MRKYVYTIQWRFTHPRTNGTHGKTFRVSNEELQVKCTKCSRNRAKTTLDHAPSESFFWPGENHEITREATDCFVKWSYSSRVTWSTDSSGGLSFPFSSILFYHCVTGYPVLANYFVVLSSSYNSVSEFLIKEMLLIRKFNPFLNVNTCSFHLTLF